MRTSGIKVATGSGASQGTGPQTIAAQLARGVPADVVILSREGLNELIAANRIAAGTDVDLAQVPLGVAVRAGTATPDVSTVEAFRQILLNAKTVAVPASTSGIWLMNDLFPRLGIAEKLDVKMGPRGSDAAGMVAAGMAAARRHARQRNRARTGRRVRRQHRAGDSVRAGILGRHRGRLGSERSLKTTDRVSRLGPRVRSDQEQRNGAARCDFLLAHLFDFWIHRSPRFGDHG